MKFPEWLHVEGDQKYRNKKCPKEGAEHNTFVNQLRVHHADLHRLMIHPKNEGKRTKVQADRDKMEGSINTGASDFIIPCCPPIIIELKREDHTASHWEDGQQDYLETAQNMGAKVCVALGWQNAMKFVADNRQ